MAAVFLVFVLSLLSVLNAAAAPASYTRMVDTVSASVVRVTGSDGGVCTGFVVADNRVLTAAHCLMPDEQADGMSASVVKVDHVSDLLLLAVTTHKAPLRLRPSPIARFDDVTAIGYGFGWTVPLVLHQRVILANPRATVVTDDGSRHPAGLVVQGQYVGGMSGGPVVDDHGRVVSVAQQYSGGIGSGASVEAIRSFLEVQ